MSDTDSNTLSHPPRDDRPELVGYSSGGVEIAISDLGGSGQIALCSHGVGLHGRIFAPLAKELHDVVHCYGIDLRGHGLSSPAPDVNYDWEFFVDDVMAAIAAIGGAPVIGIGHSAGGAALVLTEIRHPGTFSAIFAYEPIIRTPEIRREGLSTRSRLTERRRANFPSREEAYVRFRSRPPFDVTTYDALAAYVEYGFDDLSDGTVQLRCLPTHEAAVYRQGFDAYIYEQLDQVRCPVLIATGSESDNIGGRAAPDAVASLFDGRLAVLEGLRHLGPMQDPAMIATVIRDFIEQCVPEPS